MKTKLSSGTTVLASGIEADKTHAPEVPGDVEQTSVDIGKAKELLDYSPGYDLEEGLLNVVY